MLLILNRLYEVIGFGAVWCVSCPTLVVQSLETSLIIWFWNKFLIKILPQYDFWCWTSWCWIWQVVQNYLIYSMRIKQSKDLLQIKTNHTYTYSINNSILVLLCWFWVQCHNVNRHFKVSETSNFVFNIFLIAPIMVFLSK